MNPDATHGRSAAGSRPGEPLSDNDANTAIAVGRMERVAGPVAPEVPKPMCQSAVVLEVGDGAQFGNGKPNLGDVLCEIDKEQ